MSVPYFLMAILIMHASLSGASRYIGLVLKWENIEEIEVP